MKKRPSILPAELLLPAAAIEALLLCLRCQGEARLQIPETIGLLLATSLFYLVSVYLMLRIPSGNDISRFPKRWTFAIVLVGIAFRMTVWGMLPWLSDDAYRYRWEGMLQAHGGNPYQSRPVDPEWQLLQDETFAMVGSKDVKAGYGPLVELIERWTYRGISFFTPDAFRQVLWFKTPSALFDIGVMVVLWALLAASGLPTGRVLIYAWCPLPVVEFWGNGHNDSIAIFFVLLALLAAKRERWYLGFAALTLAAGAKIWPLLLFPIFVGWKPAKVENRFMAWIRGRPEHWRGLWVALPITALLVWPYWSNVEENVRFMSGFVGGWRNNDSLYGLLLWLTGDQYPAKYIAFAIIGAGVVLATLLRWPLERAVLLGITVLLLASANCHPWYLSWILPLLAVTPVVGLLLWVLLMPLAYRVLIEWVLLEEWHGSTPWRWLIYVPVFCVLAGEGLWWLLRRGNRTHSGGTASRLPR